MTFSPFLCLIEEIMQCFFVNGAKIVFNSFRYNKSLKPKKERNGNVNITVRQSRQSGVARATCPD